MKEIIVLIIVALFLLSTISLDLAYAGWKENYRTKYSKKQLDPNSEKARKIKRLLNFDIEIKSWAKTPEERKALGLGEPKRSLSAYLIPSNRTDEDKDKFEGFTTNLSIGRKTLAKEEPKTKSGYTLTDVVKQLGSPAPEE